MKKILTIILLFATVFSAAALEPYAVVTVPVANLREEPRHGAELMSQGVMGTPMTVRSRTGEWLAVTLPDGYDGYMIANSVALMDSAAFDRWRTSPRACVDVRDTGMRLSPSADAQMVSPLQLDDIVTVSDTVEGGKWLHVALPDGREGYLPSADAGEFRLFGSGAPADVRAASIIRRGKEILGQEYLWGGTSIKGNDCSGFTRVLFQSEGTYLPRDAWQQALAGEAVTADALLPGDLVFFSNAKGRVNHVGIYIGDGLMMHCSGRVRIDRLFGNSDVSDGFPRYPGRPSAFRRVLSGAPLESDTKANTLYFTNFSK